MSVLKSEPTERSIKYRGLLATVGVMVVLLVAFSGVNQGTAPGMVTISSPVNGSNFAVGSEVIISATATDMAGIVQIEMWVNNMLTGIASAPPGQTLPIQLNLMLRWVPAQPGAYTLQARSVNGQNLAPVSAPVVITVVQAGQPTITPVAPTPIPSPAPCAPLAIVQARTLNVRSGPGTGFGVLGRMGQDETAQITGRNAAGTWWRIRYGTAHGWVSASYVAASCVENVPVVEEPTPAPTPTPAVNINFRADATTINAGQCTTIRWDVDGVKAVYFNSGGGDQGVTGHESRTICPGTTTTYRLIVILTDGQRIERQITVNVQGQGYNINFRADRTQIRRGECTVLRWDVDGVKAVYISDGSQEGGVSGHGSAQICPGRTTTYVLRAVLWDNREERREVRIDVHQDQPSPVVQFEANPPDVYAGDPTTLIWNVQNAREVYLNGGGVAGQGSQQVWPQKDTTYVLRVVGLDGSSTDYKVTVRIIMAIVTPTIRISANPTEIGPQGCSTLTWSASHGNEFYINNEPVGQNGTMQVCPQNSTDYTFRVSTYGAMDAYQTVRVNVIQEPQPEPPQPEPQPQPEPPQPEPDILIGPGGLPPTEEPIGPLMGPGVLPE